MSKTHSFCTGTMTTFITLRAGHLFLIIKVLVSLENSLQEVNKCKKKLQRFRVRARLCVAVCAVHFCLHSPSAAVPFIAFIATIWKNYFRLVVAVVWAFTLCWILVTLTLLFGTITNRPPLLLPHIVFSVIIAFIERAQRLQKLL